ncbi:MAG: hypothetical protein ACJAYX_003333 [Planctomycetota bacterium]|jgi:hypothetical protein
MGSSRLLPNYTMQQTTLRVAADRDRRWIDVERLLVGLSVVPPERITRDEQPEVAASETQARALARCSVLWSLGADRRCVMRRLCS